MLSPRLTPVCGAKMVVPFICAHGPIIHCRTAGGTGRQDTGYYKIPFTVTPRHLHSKGNEKSVTVTEDVALLLSFVSYLFGQQILSHVIQEARPRATAVREGLESLASLSFSLMRKESSDEGRLACSWKSSGVQEASVRNTVEQINKKIVFRGDRAL